MDVNTEPLVTSRSRRQRVDKYGRHAALEKLRQLKGGKHKYELKDDLPVYEEVAESEYSKLVQSRQEDDWIVDDDGSGYVEDGREIFDDDINDEVDDKDKSSSNERKKRFKPPPARKAAQKKVCDIKSMFMAAPAKKKTEKEVKLDDDELLGSIIEEVHSGSIGSSAVSPKPTILKKKEYHQASPQLKRAVNPFAIKTPVRALQSRELLRPRAVEYNHHLPEKSEFKDGNTLHSESPSKKLLTGTFSNEKVTEVTKTKKYVTEQQEAIVENGGISDIEQYDSTDLMEENNKAGNCIEEWEKEMNLDDVNIEEAFSEPMEVDDAKTLSKMNYQPDVRVEEVGDMWEGPSIPVPSVIDVRVDNSQLPVVTNEEGQEVLRFYWIDAFEDYYKHPGVVYLFGKIWIETAKTHVSCCICVRNIERRVFLLPRLTHVDPKTKQDTGKAVVMKDVYLEFNDVIAEKYKINEFKTKKSVKSYAFGKCDVPDEAEYLEVRYSASLPALPSDLKGNTFSHVFGTNTSSLEQLLLDRRMKGPGWIDIISPQISNPPVSWCKIEAILTKPDNIVVLQGSLPPPPLIVLSLNLKTVINNSNHQNEIVAAACLVHHQFPIDKAAPSPPFQTHFCSITKPSNIIFPFDFKDALGKYNHTKVERMDSERALLCFLLAKIHKLDPDVIVGHDLYGFDLDILLHRVNANKIPHWSRIGRLKRSGMPQLGVTGHKNTFVEKSTTCGRLICDIKISAKELIRSKSYDLSELVHLLLRKQRQELDTDTIRSMFGSSRQLLRLIDLVMQDADYVLRLMCELSVLPLALQITNIAGNLMTRTLLGGRSERNEFLLLHAFYEKNFICPDKTLRKQQAKVEYHEDDDVETGRSKKRKRKPAYTGGLVLDPKRGFYDKHILLMDFNSLYPSIIQEYNICFTTISRDSAGFTNDEEDEIQVELPDPSLEPGVLPTEIRKLVESRRQVKQLMKNSDLSTDLQLQYDIRQKALKLTANSMYGCLGFSFSRFYAKPLAALITSKGREILLQTKDLVQKMGLEVIYGDTDSIMINTNSTDYEQVFKLGNKIKGEVNKLYKQLEIDIDGVFKSMLLLKKKKYAAQVINRLPNGQLSCSKELKGLDIVRRDWSGLAKQTGEFVISEILSDKTREDIVEAIHAHLLEVGNKIRDGKVPLTEFTITKQLTKNPEDYPDKKSLPHVQVALRLNSRGGKKLRHGDTVSYIICEDGSNLAATQRGYSTEEIKNNENLKVDVQYYLANQIHPVVSRLCDPIEGSDSATIAEFLGLDPSGYQKIQHHQDDDDDALLGGKSQLDEDRFKDCEKLYFTCPNEQCREKLLVESCFKNNVSDVNIMLQQCSSCQTSVMNYCGYLSNQLTRVIRSYIHKYYQGWLQCEDVGCGYRTRKLPLKFTRGGPLCPVCERATIHPEYTDTQLYQQLSYFQNLFDLRKGTSEKMFSRFPPEGESLYRRLKATVDKTLKSNAYGVVNLDRLFDGLYRCKPTVCS
ncbi:DNA polymerase alpha catalytic subunit isoform X2 [Tachypleus tridentatus]|uniref:DNA polymerase alpha catalytic subunit isoform X2 n=1 Tax=Tachypleus tridentatus TaxID=6853 RepID=UPI003FD4C7D0